MIKAYLAIRPNSKLPILYTDDTIGTAHKVIEFVDSFEMYEDDIVKVNNFFIALDQLCQAADHLSPSNRERFAKVVGDAVKWNFSISNLVKAGLYTRKERTKHDRRNSETVKQDKERVRRGRLPRTLSRNASL